MRLTEIHDGIPTAAALRESTRIQRHGGKNGNQQYIDRGFGKAKNVDYEPLHYLDVEQKTDILRHPLSVRPNRAHLFLTSFCLFPFSAAA